MASLFVIRGRDSGRHFELRDKSITIGRDSSNLIHLRDTEVSRTHARIECIDSRTIRLVDLDSSNGTYVNSQRIKEQILASGDRVQIGRTLLIFKPAPEPGTAEGAGSGIEFTQVPEQADLSQIRKSIPNRIAPSSIAHSPPIEDPSDSDVVGRSDWEVMYLVGQAISRTVDIDQLMRQVLDLIFQWIHCERGCMMLVDEETGHLTQAYRRNRKPESVAPRLEISQTIVNHVLAQREGVLTSNAQDDQRWQSANSVVQQGVREAMCVPMLGRYGTLGAIYVDTSKSASTVHLPQSSGFTDEHLKLLIAIGNQAALAIEDTQFYRAMLQSERLAAMGQTIANLSHHVKNILQGMHGGGYLIQSGLKQQDLATIAKGWRIVERNQDRINDLVLDMLSFSKEREPQLQSGDIRETITEIVELMQGRAQDVHAHIQWAPNPDFPALKFDAEALHRAILNVVVNAVEAVQARQNGLVQIRLACHTDTGQVEIEIEDNGEGLDEVDLPRLFSAFESTKGARGTGLGLPVSRKILREHGGDIEVSSTKGQGTRFKLYWPGISTSFDPPTIEFGQA